jgi:hypothetical protein
MNRLAWRLLLAAIALVAVFAQLDRASARRPQLAPLVPAPFRSFAQPSIAMAAAVSADPAGARAEARRLVQRRPLPAEHLFVLALADLRTGDTGGYARAFQRATTRGWRSVPIQQAAARAALAQGDADAAANRIAALWALDASDPALHDLTRVLLANERGRRVFAARLAGTKVWQNLYLQRALELTSRSAAQAIVAEAIGEGARFDRDALSALRSAAVRP